MRILFSYIANSFSNKILLDEIVLDHVLQKNTIKEDARNGRG